MCINPKIGVVYTSFKPTFSFILDHYFTSVLFCHTVLIIYLFSSLNSHMMNKNSHKTSGEMRIGEQNICACEV